jgi:pyrimidine operon attenuation protein/uracil phosphoribosyltransferase
MNQFDAEALYSAVTAQLRHAYGDAFVSTGGVALVGIHSGGAWIAERLATELGAQHGGVNISLHRDDYAEKGLRTPAAGSTALPFEVEGRRIVLVDDVLYTGRTIRAAVNEIYDYGRPASIELAVLVDRGGRQLPIAARFTGMVTDLPPDVNLVLERDANGRFAFHTAERTG